MSGDIARPCRLSNDGVHDFQTLFQIPGTGGVFEDAYVCECGWRVLVSEVPDKDALIAKQRAAKSHDSQCEHGLLMALCGKAHQLPVGYAYVCKHCRSLYVPREAEPATRYTDTRNICRHSAPACHHCEPPK